MLSALSPVPLDLDLEAPPPAGSRYEPPPRLPPSNLSRCADDYPCLPGTAPDARFCPIKEVPFRGVNCSDAAGGEIGYQSIQAMVDSNGTITGRMYAPELPDAPFNDCFAAVS